MCKDTDSALSTASKVCPPVQDGRGVPARARDVGEELAGMTKRKRGGGGEGDGLCCNGLAARPRAGTNSLQVCGQVVVVAAPCGIAGRLWEGEEAAKEVEPDSPQNSCSVADGILMRQTKKHRIMRRRVSFCTQSSMRLVCRDLMLAQYFIDGAQDGAADDVGDQEEEEEEEAVEAAEADEAEQNEGDGAGGTGEGRVTVAAAGAQNHDRQEGSGNDGGAQSASATQAMEEDGNDGWACGAQGAAGQQERGGDVEVVLQATGGVDDEGDEEPEQDDSKVMTKTNDGPSLTNVVSQALIMGLVERQVRDVGDVLRTLRQCVVPDCFGPPADDDDDELTESELAASSDEDEGASDGSSSEMRRRCMRRRCRRGPIDPRMILDSSVFDDAHTHIQVLLDRINNNGRASLLPSTVQIGPPFIPALEFLLLSTKEAQSLNEQDRVRVARMSAAAEGRRVRTSL